LSVNPPIFPAIVSFPRRAQDFCVAAFSILRHL
jgi:hypothetical protein